MEITIRNSKGLRKMRTKEEVEKRIKIIQQEFSEEEKKFHERLVYCYLLLVKLNELRWFIDLPPISLLVLR